MDIHLIRKNQYGIVLNASCLPVGHTPTTYHIHRSTGRCIFKIEFNNITKLPGQFWYNLNYKHTFDSLGTELTLTLTILITKMYPTSY